MKRTFALLSLFALAGCGSTIDASHYRQTCTVDADCVVVTAGQVCAACMCPNAAINKSDLSRFNADRSLISSFCPPSGAACLADCKASPPTCFSGTCALVQATP